MDPFHGDMGSKSVCGWGFEQSACFAPRPKSRANRVRKDGGNSTHSAVCDAGSYRYVILDHDAKFNADVIAFLKATGLRAKRTSVQAPWQNGIAERWIGSCRREFLDHVIALNEQHLQRLMRDYVNYHQDDRIHDSLNKDAPNRRPILAKTSPQATVISDARLGGLHHRYSWREAA